MSFLNVTFDQLNVSLLNKSITYVKKNLTDTFCMVVNVFKVSMLPRVSSCYSCIWLYKDRTHTHTHYGHWDLSPDTGQELTLFFNSKGRRGAGWQDEGDGEVQRSQSYSLSSQHVTVSTAGPPLCFGAGHRAFWEVREQRSACLKKLPGGLSVPFQHSTTERFSQVNECVEKEAMVEHFHITQKKQAKVISISSDHS